MDSMTLRTATTARLRHTAQGCLPAAAAFAGVDAWVGNAVVLGAQPVLFAGAVAAPPPRGAPV